MQILLKRSRLLLCIWALCAFALQSCDKYDEQFGDKDSYSEGQPVIKELRSSHPAPNDSVLTKAGPGQQVVIKGQNLRTTTELYFNGYPAPFNSAIFSDNSMVVLIPGDMPFADLDQSKLNTVRVVTTFGETTFSFPIEPPPPIISGMSNENALPGGRVTLYGNNFFFIDKVIFPGNIEVSSNIVTNSSGTALQVTVPANLTLAGTVKVTNRYGTGTSIFRINDMVTGMLHNSDNVNNFSWGCDAISGNNTLFPNNRGGYNRLTFAPVAAGDGGWWNGGRSLNTNSGTWIPTANLNDPLDSWALKFEINVKNPWSAGMFYIVKDYDWTYLARYAAWQSTPDYVSNGWVTVTIPLTEFRTKANGWDGTGSSAPSLKTLVGNAGTGAIDMMFVNNYENANTTVSNFDVAIDNIRFVKIK